MQPESDAPGAAFFWPVCSFFWPAGAWPAGAWVAERPADDARTPRPVKVTSKADRSFIEPPSPASYAVGVPNGTTRWGQPLRRRVLCCSALKQRGYPNSILIYLAQSVKTISRIPYTIGKSCTYRPHKSAPSKGLVNSVSHARGYIM